MQYDREAGQTAGNFFQNIEAQLGSALELERAVGGADGYGQRVYAGALGKFLNLIRIGVGGVLGLNLNLILNAGQTAQLALNGNVAVVSILNNLAGQMFSSKGRWEPSIMTEVKPPSMQLLQVSKSGP